MNLIFSEGFETNEYMPFVGLSLYFSFHLQCHCYLLNGGCVLTMAAAVRRLPMKHSLEMISDAINNFLPVHGFLKCCCPVNEEFLAEYPHCSPSTQPSTLPCLRKRLNLNTLPSKKFTPIKVLVTLPPNTK